MGDSGNDDSHDGGRDKAGEYYASLPITISQLHEAIEALGPNAWRMFTRLWEIACEIPAPLKRPLYEASPQADSALNQAVEAPPRPDAATIEPGMPDRVAGFLRHQPRDPPAWVYPESPAERVERHELEDIGGWVGG